MVRGPVVPQEARAWSAGRLASDDYFERARRRAFAKASDAVRDRLHRLNGNGGLNHPDRAPA
jgi:hypothetical protein